MLTRVHRSAILFALALTLAGCGSTEHPAAEPTATHQPTAAQRAAVTQVVADFVNHYQRAEGRAFCGLFTPEARAGLERDLHAAAPSTRGKRCPALIVDSGLYGDPADQPAAVAEAAAFDFKGIAVDGSRATLTFPDGHRWRLVRRDGRWLIAALPFLPPSLAGAG
jgi:hypothetical protein